MCQSHILIRIANRCEARPGSPNPRHSRRLAPLREWLQGFAGMNSMR